MKVVKLKKPLFGKSIEIIIYDMKVATAKKVALKGYREALRLDKIFNFFDNQSILFRLNKKRKMVVPVEFLEVLKLALRFSKITNGKYDISLGRNFLRRKNGLDLINLKCSYKDIKIKKNKVELLHPEVMLDFGSIAKGYIADKVAETLKSNGVMNGAINSRGDIFVFGNYSHKVDIQHPRKKESIIFSEYVKNSGIATSGDYKQYDKNYKKSHLLNNRTFASVTVVASTLMEADIYATVFSVISKESMKEILKKRKSLSVVTVEKNLKIKEYNKLENRYFK